ncbi:hypothetical protein SAMN05660226_04087 [Parapedobacter luteus]|uniref:Uncharacterized protein n=1 Tax=Parapedobacter luteus TaxID=623280 RepID=A0A1T5FM64_9SPHI|nr:hypothetical protein SAMN05660226_04087 [Parapedobacter luteus]
MLVVGYQYVKLMLINVAAHLFVYAFIRNSRKRCPVGRIDMFKNNTVPGQIYKLLRPLLGNFNFIGINWPGAIAT